MATDWHLDLIHLWYLMTFRSRVGPAECHSYMVCSHVLQPQNARVPHKMGPLSVVFFKSFPSFDFGSMDYRQSI